MRFCGAGEAFSSYQKIEKEEEASEEMVQFALELGEGSRRHSKRVERESSGRIEGFKLSTVLSRKSSVQELGGSHHRMRIKLVDLLVGYQSLIQFATSPLTVQKKELHPTIGFIQQPVLQVESGDPSKSPLFVDA